nr:BppU family phage baseplate upper protein [uncultured Ruminococcus sp.]
MNINHTKMTLEINSCKNYEILEVRQGDKGSRIIDFAFTVNGEIVDLASTMSAKVNATVDDVIVAEDVAAVVDTENNVVTVTLTDTMLALSGICKMDIVLTEGDEIITAETVCLRVGKSVINDDSKAFPGASSIAEITKEVENARGDSADLNTRFTADEASLSAVKSEIATARGSYDNLDQRLNDLIVDDEGVISTFNLADGAVTTAIIEDGAVTQNKLSADLKSAVNSIVNKADTADVDTALATKADKATTIDGYGITDAYTQSQIKTKLEQKLNKMPFDSEPKQESPCYLTSGAVYNALLAKADKTALATKYDSSNVEVGKGELTPAQAIYDGYEGSFNYSKIGKTVTVALNITTLVAGKNYVQFAGLPFMAMTASRLSSIAVYTTVNKLVNIRLDGSWLYINSPGTTFAEGEKINVIVTYIIG